MMDRYERTMFIHWLNFSFTMLFLRVFKKKLQNISFEAFLSFVVDEMFIEVPIFQETSPALKNTWLRSC